MPSQATAHRGPVRAQLSHAADISVLSFADRLLSGEADYIAEIDGWVLNFWAQDKMSHKHSAASFHRPESSFDLRVVHRAHSEVRGLIFSFRYEIFLTTRTGVFSFYVRTSEEADAWVRCVEQIVVERLQQEMREKLQAEERSSLGIWRTSAPSLAWVPDAMLRLEHLSIMDDQLRCFAPPPQREGAVRRLWADCVNAAPDPAPAAVFAELFDLYDLDDDGNLELEELELMIGELWTIRRRELEVAKACIANQANHEERVLLGGVNLEVWEKRASKLSAQLSAWYQYNLGQGGGMAHRLGLLRQDMDVSGDGRLSVAEFVRNAPGHIMTTRELQLERRFYKCVEDGLAAARKAQGFEEPAAGETECRLS